MSLPLRCLLAVAAIACLSGTAAVPASAAIDAKAHVQVPGKTVALKDVTMGTEVIAWLGDDSWAPLPVSRVEDAPPWAQYRYEVYLQYTLPGHEDGTLVLDVQHPVMTDRGLVEAGWLTQDDRLLSPNGWVDLKKIMIGEFSGDLRELSLGDDARPTSDPRGHLLLANGVAVGDWSLEIGWRPDRDVLDDLLDGDPSQHLSNYRGVLPLSRPVSADSARLSRYVACLTSTSAHSPKSHPQRTCDRPTTFRVVSRESVNADGNIHLGVVCPPGYRLHGVVSTQRGSVGVVQRVRLSRAAVYLGADTPVAPAVLRATGTCTWSSR